MIVDESSKYHSIMPSVKGKETIMNYHVEFEYVQTT